jgi:N-methylhydantoinase B
MSNAEYDAIRLEIFKHLFAALAEEMGVVLRRASHSPNIKERRDYSCAVFDPKGDMIAQAAHIPVHLGSMPLSVQAAIQAFDGENRRTRLNPGDAILLNDPYQGGTHLPDITLVTPVFFEERLPGPDTPRLVGFVANRAHHADVGGISPGSMPVASEIYQEGLIIPPVKIIDSGELNQGVFDMILANVRTPLEREGDLRAQLAANRRGAQRLNELVRANGFETIAAAMEQLLAYTERLTRSLLSEIPDGNYSFTDVLDDNGVDHEPLPIKARISIIGETAEIDFSGTALQQPTSVNAVFPITLSAVYYVLRCLLGLDVPNNSGCMRPVIVFAPAGCLVNATHPAPVAGGNVETSQRIVDVLLGALHHACPERIPAASQGTMNNLIIGGPLPGGQYFTYYETIGGGMGARPSLPGLDGVHTHMTNTLNTPAEALEYAYPLRVKRYELRKGSGGDGKFRGGAGIRRDIEVLVDAQATLLTERRVCPPYGLAGGEPGEVGSNILVRGDSETNLPGKGTIRISAGEVISIRTPGGGGYGEPE